ncbi:hypothetical protein BVY03_02980 [bacterium K02(2017)]|nr:hypothetical protein BVY03_02980 [bacterium K02(2017)]
MSQLSFALSNLPLLANLAVLPNIQNPKTPPSDLTALPKIKDDQKNCINFITTKPNEELILLLKANPSAAKPLQIICKTDSLNLENDYELAQAIKVRSKPAFEYFTKKYQGMIRGLILKSLKYYSRFNPEDINDLSQIVLEKVWGKIHQFRGGSKFSTWVGRIVLNVCSMYKREKYRNFQQDLSDTETENKENKLQSRYIIASLTEKAERSPENTLLINENIKKLKEIMNKLTAADLELLSYRLEDLPFEEIAAKLGLRTAGAKTRYFRLKEKIKVLVSNK